MSKSAFNGIFEKRFHKSNLIIPALMASIVFELVFVHYSWAAWSVKTVDLTGYGRWSSGLIAIDNNSKPHIVYGKPGTAELIYSSWTGTAWTKWTVDSGFEFEGFSIKVDGTDKPHISYVDQTNSKLKHAYWTGTSWNKEDVDTDAMGVPTSLAIDGSNNLHVSYRGSSSVKYAKWNGSWNTPAIIASVTDNASIALNPNNSYPSISYGNTAISPKRIQCARWNGGTWTIVDDVIFKTLDSRYPNNSIAINSGGYEYILVYRYPDYTQPEELRLFNRNAAGTWDTRRIDPDSGAGRGDYFSITFDTANVLHMVYGVSYTNAVRYAKMSVNGTVTITTITPSGYGDGTGIAVDRGNNPHVVFESTSGIKIAVWINPPTNFTGTVLSSSSIRWDWADNEIDEDVYYIYTATNGIVSILSSNTNSWAETDLIPNTQYTRYSGVSKNFGEGISNSVSVYTFAAIPASPVINSIGSSSATVSWGTNGNPDGTQYEVDYWTLGGSTTSTQVSAANAVISILSAATTYYFRVRAINHDGVYSDPSQIIPALTLPPAPTTVSGVAQGISSITWTWDSVTTAMQYKFYPSTGGPGIPVMTTTLTQTGLSSNTAYGASISAVNLSGEGALSGIASRYTLAAIPSAPSINPVGGSSITISWDANGNPEGTQYQVDCWTLGGSTNTVDFSAANGIVNNLTPSTTYYLTVKAKNGDGIFSEPSEVVTALTRPPAPGNLSGAAMGVSSITWTWDGVATATQYKWYASTGGTGITITGPPLMQTGLLANTAYGARVSAINLSGEGSMGGLANRYTLASPPTNLSSASVSDTSLTLNWTGNGSSYMVDRASDVGGAPGTYASIGNVVSATFPDSGLSRATTYWYRIKAYNGDNVINPEPSSAISILTQLDISSPTGSPTMHENPSQYSRYESVTYSWDAGTSADMESGISGYYLQVGINTGVGDASLYSSDVGNVLTKSVSGAQTGMTYYARVSAKNGAGLYGSYSDWSGGILVDTVPPNAPSITSPSHPHHDIAYANDAPDFVISAPIGAEVSGLSGYYCYLVDGSTGTNPKSTCEWKWFSLTPISVHADALLSDGTWYFHVLTSDIAGNLGAVEHYKLIVKKFMDDTTAQNIFTFADGSTIDIPAGGLSSPTTIQLRVPVSTEIPPGAHDPHFRLSAVVKDISLAGQDGNTLLNGNMTITLKYTNADITGLNEDGLKISYYDAQARTWKVVSNSAVYPAQKKVIAVVNHLTLFAITGGPSAGTNAVYGLTNYPNPFAAGAGRTTKIRYSLRADSAVELKIYDLLGKLVLKREFAAGASPGGMMGPNEVPWDGKNGNGDYVAPGGYICVVKSADGKQKVKIGVK